MSVSTNTASTTGRSIAAATGIACGILLMLFAFLAWTAVAGKSATADESYHALAGWLHLWQHDDQFDTEHPPLWNIWAALPNGPHALQLHPLSQDWSAEPLDTGGEFEFTVKTLYRTPANDARQFLQRERAMMLLVGLALVAGISALCWRWARAGGATPAAASVGTLTACALGALDPNLLAHAPLVKNDVPTAAAMLAVIAAAWALGRRLTPLRVIAMGVAAGVALAVKHSGIAIDVIAIALLAVRAVMPAPWPLWNARRLQRRRHRVGAALGAAVAVVGIAVGLLWLAYGLRFRPATESDSSIDFAPLAHRIIERTWQARQPGTAPTPPTPTPADLAHLQLPVLARLACIANAHHLLPQAWLAGLLHTEQSALLWPAFALGQFSRTGWWWYFPLVIAVKTPVATAALMGLATLVGCGRVFPRRRISPSPAYQECKADQPSRALWSAICLLLPVAAYLAAAMCSNLNLGIRHLLPIYPLLFVAIGLAAAMSWDAMPRVTAVFLALALVGLASETLAAYPNFIPFFNVLAGGSRGGIRLLSDSNLDWGQDLPLLAQWQREHPGVKLYLAYFGTADPSYYGIHYTNLPAGYQLGPPVGRIDSPGVIAISATLLQGTYDRGRDGRSLYQWLADAEPPMAVLGGSIYLFQYPTR
jgi:hypothetical protein